MSKGSDLLVAALENEGVDRIFGIPGEENLDVVESIRKSSLELILTRHEQAAAFMAATHGRLTGRPGVCITTLGPGALNLTTGAAYALLGAMPMIMITGQKGVRSSRQARFQIVDVVAAMKPLTKLSRQIVSPRMIPGVVREAFRVAGEERPGPVHLELPEDIAAEECDAVAPIPPHPVELPDSPVRAACVAWSSSSRHSSGPFGASRLSRPLHLVKCPAVVGQAARVARAAPRQSVESAAVPAQVPAPDRAASPRPLLTAPRTPPSRRRGSCCAPDTSAPPCRRAPVLGPGPPAPAPPACG